MERRFGYTTRLREGLSFRCYFETVPSDLIKDPEEKARVQAWEADGHDAAIFYAAGTDNALGMIARHEGTPMTEAEFVAARDQGWPVSRANRTTAIHLGGSLDVTHTPADG